LHKLLYFFWFGLLLIILGVSGESKAKQKQELKPKSNAKNII